jgi:hypothetical protein
MGQETMTTDDRLTPAIIASSAMAGAALIIATIVLSWPPPKTLSIALQLLGIALTTFGVGVVHTALQRVIAVALGATDTARHQLTLWRHALCVWWARRRGLPPPTIRVRASWLSRYDIHDDLFRARPATEHGDHAALLAAVDADLDKVFARINKIKDSIAALRDEIQRETRRGWQLILAGLAWSAVGTLVGIWT